MLARMPSLVPHAIQQSRHVVGKLAKPTNLPDSGPGLMPADVAPQRDVVYHKAIVDKGLAQKIRAVGLPQCGGQRLVAIRALLESPGPSPGRFADPFSVQARPKPVALHYVHLTRRNSQLSQRFGYLVLPSIKIRFGAICSVRKAQRLAIPVRKIMAIVGRDDSPTAALSMVDMSSVNKNSRRQGRIAAKTLFSRIGGRHLAAHIPIEPSPILRGSI